MLKGKIEIVCNDTGAHIMAEIEDAQEKDNLFLVHALGKALGLQARDYMVLCAAEASGLLDEAERAVISIDPDGLLRRFMKEEDNNFES